MGLGIVALGVDPSREDEAGALWLVSPPGDSPEGWGVRLNMSSPVVGVVMLIVVKGFKCRENDQFGR